MQNIKQKLRMLQFLSTGTLLPVSATRRHILFYTFHMPSCSLLPLFAASSPPLASRVTQAFITTSLDKRLLPPVLSSPSLYQPARRDNGMAATTDCRAIVPSPSSSLCSFVHCRVTDKEGLFSSIYDNAVGRIQPSCRYGRLGCR